MKSFNIGLLALTLGIMPQVGLAAVNKVVKNPVDLTPTAEQNSGAEYNDSVTDRPIRRDGNTVNNNVDANNNMASRTIDDTNSVNAMDTSGNTNHDVNRNGARSHIVTTTTDSNSNGLVNHTMDQQAQEEPVRSSGAGWWIALFAVLIGGALYYASRKRDTNGHHMNPRV